MIRNYAALPLGSGNLVVARKRVDNIVVKHVLERERLQAALRETELLAARRAQELLHVAEHDRLTGLYNRTAFCRKTAELLAAHPDEEFAVIQFDIERFKIINELYGSAKGDEVLLNSIPEALAVTNNVCSSVNVASTKAGINLDAVSLMGHIIKATAEMTRDNQSMGCAKLVVFANAVDDNPFMAGAFHGIGEPETVINVGVSGPGVVQSAIRRAGDCSIGEIAEIIKKTAFKITRMGQLVGSLASERLGVPFGIVDLSLAPTPAVGDSVARIIEEVGLETCGGCGTTAILAMLNDAVKKGGVMASSNVGGLSGAFIPVSEDEGMIAAAQSGVLTMQKLEAMTAVCSVGIDMVAVPGDTTAEVISGLIADEIAIGVVNTKTTAVRVIPAIGKKVGDSVEFGGLLGSAPIMPVPTQSPAKFIHRGGRIPAPIHSLKN